jgi:hypothetical protein
MVLDMDGNVIAAGESDNENNSDFVTLKFAASNGALLWEHRYNGPGDDTDIAQAVAVDGSGNVIVSGLSGNGPPNYDSDYYTVKYAATNGALLWERRYNGPTNGDDYATAIAVDMNGNVFVTGSSVGTNPKLVPDFYTAKYAAADGAVLWEKRYDGPAHKEDFAKAVAVDARGDIVVTGYSTAADGFSDYLTIKYAGTNGAVLWEQRYNGPSDNDYAEAVAVDGKGNVVVTGTSRNTTDDDCYTAKYAAADGTLLWEKRYNGTIGGEDSVASSHGLAIGPDGIVVILGLSDGDFGLGGYINIVYRETLLPVSVERIATGFRLRFSGVAGHSYQIERASDLTGPWITNATRFAMTNGLLEYIDTNSPAGSAFYRTSTGF